MQLEEYSILRNVSISVGSLLCGPDAADSGKAQQERRANVLVAMKFENVHWGQRDVSQQMRKML